MSLPSSTSTPAVIEYGPPINLEQARRVVQAAEAEARRNGWPMVIAVVDSGGQLVLLERMDQAQYGSVLIAQQKAQTSVSFKRSTKAFEDALEKGGANLRMLGTTNILPVEGGMPLMSDGKIVGAIGVSGMTSQQDAQVAEAGASVL